MIIYTTSFNFVQKYEIQIFHFIDTLMISYIKKTYRLSEEFQLWLLQIFHGLNFIVNFLFKKC